MEALFQLLPLFSGTHTVRTLIDNEKWGGGAGDLGCLKRERYEKLSGRLNGLRKYKRVADE